MRLTEVTCRQGAKFQLRQFESFEIGLTVHFMISDGEDQVDPDLAQEVVSELLMGQISPAAAKIIEKRKELPSA